MDPPVLKFTVESATVQLNAIANGFEACKRKVSRQTSCRLMENYWLPD
jgi:hypothetical protein